MLIIIDGYNLLKQLYTCNQISLKERKLFIQDLQRYAIKKNHEIQLVFDGGSTSFMVKEYYQKVTVIYPGIGKSADDYIIDYCNDHFYTMMIVISSDKAMLKQIENKHLVPLDSWMFSIRMKKALENKKQNKIESTLIKFQEENVYIDELMQQAAQLKQDKIEDENEAQKKLKINSKKLSKEERRLQTILEKL